jgi:hypothetical protein
MGCSLTNLVHNVVMGLDPYICICNINDQEVQLSDVQVGAGSSG